MASKLIVVTGADGAGKSTLINALLEDPRFAGRSHRAQIWDPLMRLPGIARDPLQSYLVSLTPTSRSLFLFHALQEALSMARKANKEFIFFDGYWFKYYLTELERGAPSQLLQSLASALPKPDLVFFLETTGAQSLERKKSEGLSLYEKSSADGLSFSERIEKAKDLWKVMEDELGPWIHFSVDSSIKDRIEMSVQHAKL